MKVPTIAEYNNWTHRAKHRLIEIESKGVYKKLDRAQGYFPFLIYEKENVGIVYQVNAKGQITEAVAMTVKEAIDRLVRFYEASKAMAATN